LSASDATLELRGYPKGWLASSFNISLAQMLTEFDQSTIANMTAALEFVCKKIPANLDTRELRKQLSSSIISAANNGASSFVDFQNAGLKTLDGILRPPKSNRLSRLFR
jgi:hypothetical protein